MLLSARAMALALSVRYVAEMVHPSLKNTLRLPCGTPDCDGQQIFNFKLLQTITWRCSVCNMLQSKSKAQIAAELEAKGATVLDLIE
ncbi:hypothetical protein [Sphingomonas colocasiae]|uniref:Uncharacterized protein n=1 Tax=Sphingomonas colocasiae TaxID=1848973 RepID=A0ABS7PT57_9SPHN|nr:hypothetical protein [Sphingomonas colocasiae]MBY8823860.1 hypothetical protein [Sphingomonas colocasiae]